MATAVPENSGAEWTITPHGLGCITEPFREVAEKRRLGHTRDADELSGAGERDGRGTDRLDLRHPTQLVAGELAKAPRDCGAG